MKIEIEYLTSDKVQMYPMPKCEVLAFTYSESEINKESPAEFVVPVYTLSLERMEDIFKALTRCEKDEFDYAKIVVKGNKIGMFAYKEEKNRSVFINFSQIANNLRFDLISKAIRILEEKHGRINASDLLFKYNKKNDEIVISVK